MTLANWLLYFAAVLVLTVTPGPTVLLCISTAVQGGVKPALVSALGTTAAIVGLMLLSMAGLGTVLAASESLFTALKWLGGAYLAYLGLRSLLSKEADLIVPEGPVAGALGAAGARGGVALWPLFRRGLLVGASNPKALLFFGALFPQFIDPAAPHAPQFLVMGLTFVVLELFWLFVYASTAARAKQWLQKPRRALAFNRATGAVFLWAAALVATAKRPAAT
jgi:threonine/homoserine/homoserine lactone efflux protein